MVGTSALWLVFRKKGFLDSDASARLLEGDPTMGAAGCSTCSGSCGTAGAGAGGGGGGGGGEAAVVVGNTWLCVGVLSWGVMLIGPSSSEELSSPRPSSSRCNWRSLSLAASSSARWACSLASLSLASRSAASFRRFSSCFLILPCLTCSSRARRRASWACFSLSISSSWRLASSLNQSQHYYIYPQNGNP